MVHKLNLKFPIEFRRSAFYEKFILFLIFCRLFVDILLPCLNESLRSFLNKSKKNQSFFSIPLKLCPFNGLLFVCGPGITEKLFNAEQISLQKDMCMFMLFFEMKIPDQNNFSSIQNEFGIVRKIRFSIKVFITFLRCALKLFYSLCIKKNFIPAHLALRLSWFLRVLVMREQGTISNILTYLYC